MKKHTVALILLAAVCATSVFAGTYSKTVDKVFPLPQGGEIYLSNTNGPIHITTWDRDEVKLFAEKVVKTGSSRRAEEIIEEVRIDIRHEDGLLEIETIYPRRSSGWLSSLFGDGADVHVSYRLTIPRQAKLDVSTVNGKVRIEDLTGAITTKTTNGRIIISGAEGPVEAKTTNGGIEVELVALAEKDDLYFKTTNGSIDVTLPSSFRADIDAKTTNGSVRTDFPIEIRGELSKTRLRGKINGGGGSVRLYTTNGSIRLTER